MEESVQQALDDAGRACMKLIGTPGISDDLNNRLARFLYGCMNQRLTIVERVRQRGPGEYDKVLKFVAKAAQLVVDIEKELDTSQEKRC